MKHYNGPSGWISATLPAPKPGSLGWKVAAAVFRYHNLRAHPDDVEVDVRGGRRRVRARQATREEAAELWPRLTETYPRCKTYMTRTDRELPVMILEPR